MYSKYITINKDNNLYLTSSFFSLSNLISFNLNDKVSIKFNKNSSSYACIGILSSLFMSSFFSFSSSFLFSFLSSLFSFVCELLIFTFNELSLLIEMEKHLKKLIFFKYLIIIGIINSSTKISKYSIVSSSNLIKSFIIDLYFFSEFLSLAFRHNLYVINIIILFFSIFDKFFIDLKKNRDKIYLFLFLNISI